MLISSDELMHWKYVKKVRKNGKWVYYYDNSEVKNAKKNVDKALVDTAYENANDHINLTSRSRSRSPLLAFAPDDNNRKPVTLSEISKNEAKRRAKVDNLVNKYKKVKTKHIFIKPLAKAIAFISNLFSGSLFSKKKKKKK